MSNGIAKTSGGVTLKDFMMNPSRFNTISSSFGNKARAEAAMNVFLSSIGPNKKLAKCTPRSLYTCIERSAQLKLSINGVLGESWAIPFKDEATFILGYQGMRTLALRHPDVGAIDSFVVYDGDFFDVQLGSKMEIVHRPYYACGNDKGEAQFAYTVVRLNNEMIQFRVMSKLEIEDRRDRSPSWKNHKKYGATTPWITDPEPMWMKTTLRAIWPQIPKSIEAYQAVSMDADDVGYVAPVGEPVSQAEELLASLEEPKADKDTGEIQQSEEKADPTNRNEDGTGDSSPDPHTTDGAEGNSPSDPPAEQKVFNDAPDAGDDEQPTLDLADDNEGRGAAIEIIMKMLEHISKADWNQLRIAFQKNNNIRSWKTASIKQLEELYNIVREKLTQRGINPDELSA